VRRLLRLLLQAAAAAADEPTPAAPGPKDGPGPKSGPGPAEGPGPKSGPGPAAKPTLADEPAAEDDATAEPKPDADAAAAAEGDTPATVTETDEKPSNVTEKTVSLDAAAVVEELPGGPKAMIEVLTSIQPLTKEESDSVLGTTGSEYFKQTFRKTLGATNLTLVDDLVVKVAEPQKEFKWPQAPAGKKKNDSEYHSLAWLVLTQDTVLQRS
jgi:hypothetical protein